MRAADADREQFAARLRQALDEGRLSLDELDERLRDVYAARTFGDLDQLVADLPTVAYERSQLAQVSPTGLPQPVPPSRHQENPKLPAWLSLSWRAWLVAVSINLVIWFLVSLSTADPAYFWPMWVAGPWAGANIALMILFPPRRRP
jgi:hypothetical protein